MTLGLLLSLSLHLDRLLHADEFEASDVTWSLMTEEDDPIEDKSSKRSKVQDQVEFKWVG